MYVQYCLIHGNKSENFSKTENCNARFIFVLYLPLAGDTSIYPQHVPSNGPSLFPFLHLNPFLHLKPFVILNAILLLHQNLRIVCLSYPRCLSTRMCAVCCCTFAPTSLLSKHHIRRKKAATRRRVRRANTQRCVEFAKEIAKRACSFICFDRFFRIIPFHIHFHPSIRSYSHAKVLPSLLPALLSSLSSLEKLEGDVRFIRLRFEKSEVMITQGTPLPPLPSLITQLYFLLHILFSFCPICAKSLLHLLNFLFLPF